MYRPPTRKPRSRPVPTQELRLGVDERRRLDGGISYKYIDSQIKDNQSPDMKNVNADDRGGLTKRPGQDRVYTTSLGTGQINGAYQRLYKSKRVFTWSTKMYTQTGSSAPTQIYASLTDAEGVFFSFDDILYYLNRNEFVQWNDTTVTTLTPYVPTVRVSTPPAGGGTANEDFNLIGAGFQQNFSGDNATTTYQLVLTNLDATEVTIEVDEVALTEDTEFTVDRTAGTIDFTGGSAPHGAPATGTNNVEITAYKTQTGFADQINNCIYSIAYGGENDSRVFLSGNSDFPNRVFYSGLLNINYWPENNYIDVGSSSEAVNGFAIHYDKLITLKEHSLYFSVYQNESDVVSFPTFPLNSAVGCDMPFSIQIIDNNVVFGNSKRGLFIIVSTVLKDERNVLPISGNINGTTLQPGLLDLDNLDDASSVDFDGKYWLCVGDEAYVWDYSLRPFVPTGNIDDDEERLSWFYYTNINAKNWIVDGSTLIYGDRTNGYLNKFISNLNDFGSGIEGVWRSKLFNFGLPDLIKNIPYVWFSTRAGTSTNISIKFLNDTGEVTDSTTITSASFSWDNFSWAGFTWAVNRFPLTTRLKPKSKKVVHFQIEFSNSEMNKNLSILSLIIQYVPFRKVK